MLLFYPFNTACDWCRVYLFKKKTRKFPSFLRFVMEISKNIQFGAV